MLLSASLIHPRSPPVPKGLSGPRQWTTCPGASMSLSLPSVSLLLLLLWLPEQVPAGRAGARGQDQWSLLFPDCGGNSQSPIDIDTRAALHDPSLTPVQPQGYSHPGNDLFILTNNGHTVEMSLPGSMSLAGLPWRFSAVQLHLHWGSGGREGGSEHLIEGHSSSAELHVVHYNSQLYPNISVARTQLDGLAVLGVLIETGEEVNPAYENLLNHLGKVKYAGQKVSVPPFDVQALLPKQLDRFFRYNGSLTTPPCFESVLWTVFTQRVKLSHSQIEKLQSSLLSSVRNDTHAHPLVDNYRGSQPLNNRLVFASFPGDSTAFYSVGEVCAMVIGVVFGCVGLAATLHFIIRTLRSTSSWDVLPNIHPASKARIKESKQPRQDVVFKTTPNPEKEEASSQP
ncbi:carbonic anhydrase 14 isoform X2 [Lepisosteus oculatus]|uniref:carbonic anhydrase 14 isoform X2 n=1 Tax=Lepisosteus oculatus TaxID=7918 RepID=UPI003720143E